MGAKHITKIAIALILTLVRSNGATFGFEVNNPAEIFGGFTYRHDARRWEEWRD